MKKLNLIVDYVPCRFGWQAEVAISEIWTAYTKVLPTREKCKKEFEKLEARINNNA